MGGELSITSNTFAHNLPLDQQWGTLLLQLEQKKLVKNFRYWQSQYHSLNLDQIQTLNHFIIQTLVTYSNLNDLHNEIKPRFQDLFQQFPFLCPLVLCETDFTYRAFKYHSDLDHIAPEELLPHLAAYSSTDAKELIFSIRCYQESHWQTSLNLVCSGIQKYPTDGSLYALAGEIVLLRRDGNANVNQACGFFERAIHLQKGYSERLLRCITLAAYISGNLRTAYQFASIIYQTNPSLRSSTLDLIRILSHFHSSQSRNFALDSLLYLINNQDILNRLITLLCILYDNNLVQILDYSELVNRFRETSKLIQQKLVKLLSELEPICSHSTHPLLDKVLPFYQQAKGYSNLDTPFNILLSLSLSSYHFSIIESTLTQNIEKLENEIRTQFSTYIQPCLDTLSQFDTAIAQNLFTTIDGIIKQPASNRLNISEKWNAFQLFLKENEAFFELLHRYSVRITQIEANESSINFDRYQLNKMQRELWKFYLRQLFYLVLVITFWTKIYELWMKGSGFKGTIIFLSMFGFAFTMLLHPLKWFTTIRNYRETKQKFSENLSDYNNAREELELLILEIQHSIQKHFP